MKKIIINILAFLLISQLSELAAQTKHEEYLRKADEGDLESMRYVSFVYTLQGNYPEAYKWFKKGAILGDAASQNSLGDCYEEGSGVEKDIDEAVRWYKASAEQNNTMGMISLGKCYQVGNGIEKDEKKAEDLFARAYKLGDVNGASRLGTLYMIQEIHKEENGEKADYSKVLLFIKYAAEKNNALGLKTLGGAYQHALGVPQDYQEAIRLYTKAAERGNNDVFKSLGECCEKLEEHSEAYKWYLIGEFYRDNGCVDKKQSIERGLTGSSIGRGQKEGREWLKKFRGKQ